MSARGIIMILLGLLVVSPVAAGSASMMAKSSGTQSFTEPMTAKEMSAVQAAIKFCWNIGTLSAPAMEVTVTVRFDVSQDRKPVSASIRMSGFEGGDEAAANKVFEAARRAIIRCTKDGLPLPADKYESWKDLELVFDPTGMRLR